MIKYLMIIVLILGLYVTIGDLEAKNKSEDYNMISYNMSFYTNSIDLNFRDCKTLVNELLLQKD